MVAAMANSASEITEPAAPRALYIHVPFCLAKCRYCDFASEVAVPDIVQPYLAALADELTRQAPHANTLESVYIGGGTPSLLEDTEIAGLLAAVRTNYQLDTDAEISIEVNPGDCTRARADMWYESGVNRVSLGAQSFDGAVLEFLGRRHDTSDVERAVSILRDAGFANFSMDLIYGVPNQDITSWRTTLERALKFSPNHVSAYGLTYEPDTPLARDLAAGRVQPLDEETELDMYRETIAIFDTAGMQQYEISNFARPGRQCKHNLVYWRNKPYIGTGASAVSYIDGVRIENCRDAAGYVRMMNEQGSAAVNRERVTRPLVMAETCIQQLRLTDGIDRAGFQSQFQDDIADIFSAVLDELLDARLIEISETHVQLTPRGRELANEVAQRFLP
jgi:oxygen-independent coproporphyrinogen-3 oxidase